MKIRVMGTANECEVAKTYYLAIGKQENVKSVSVSKPYANRNSVNIYRLYIEVECSDEMGTVTTSPKSPKTGMRVAGSDLRRI